ncbi:thiamine pyrophosphate-binding protein [bacterium]|nr:thiamine pyrophosphate-binding protein [bacterium]
MGELYGGHIVAKYLKEVEGVDTVFSLSGGHIDKIYNGLLDYDVRIIDVRHEQAAVMMAQAWSLYRKKPGVCIVTAGPGFTNAITGIVNAQMDNAPLVVITGTAARRDWKRGALQDISQADLIKSSVKWHSLCHDINRIPEYLSEAFRFAVSGRPGPVLLELPPDILGTKTREEAVVSAQSGCVSYKVQPEESLLQKAAELINKAEKPLIIGGSGCNGCGHELRELAEKTETPFILLNTGRGVIADDHPLSIWDGGMSSLLAAMPMADVVIALGIRFNWLLMFGEMFPQAKMVRVDIEPTEINRNRIADVGLVGDMRLTLAQLLKYLNSKKLGNWREELRSAYMPMAQEEIALKEKASHPIQPVRLVSQVQKAVGDNALFLVDGGDASYFGATGFTAKSEASVFSPAGGLFGCLGTGVPFGIGAKLANPDKTVVVFNGDGSFGLNAMEFDTAVRHKIPFICIICNDQAWGMIKHGQEMTYGSDRVVASELGVVHYEKVVEALGGYGELVDKDEDIIPAIHRAVQSGKPACINVLTDPTVTSPMTLLFMDSLNMEK